jgi:hypothetical protein
VKKTMLAKKKPGKKRKRHHRHKQVFQVITIENGDPTPHYKSVVYEHDQVAWGNRDVQDYWIKFLPTWPFAVGQETLIKVPAGGGSDWHEVAVNPGAGKQQLYRYAIKTDPQDPDPPPDGPGVIADGG